MANLSTHPSDMVVYNDMAHSGYLEAVQDNVNLFNQASNGCIVLDAHKIIGNFKRESFFKAETDITWRDVESDDPVTSTGIAMGETIGAKIPWKLSPKKITHESLDRAGQDGSVFALLMGKRTAESLVSYQVTHALRALFASASSAGMTVEGSLKKERQVSLTRALRKYGDKAGRVKLFVMHSETYNDLVDKTITDPTYQAESVVLYGSSPATLGRAVLVTDVCPVNQVFGLTENAVTITESSTPIFVFYADNGTENLGVMYRGEGNFNIELLGYSYVEEQGINPKLDTISSPAAWKKIVKSDKLLGAVVLVINESVGTTAGDGH